MQLRPTRLAQVSVAIAVSPLVIIAVAGLTREPSGHGPLGLLVYLLSALLFVGFAVATWAYVGSIRVELQGERLTFKRYGIVRWQARLTEVEAIRAPGMSNLPALRLFNFNSGKFVGELLEVQFSAADLDTLEQTVNRRRSSGGSAARSARPRRL